MEHASSFGYLKRRVNQIDNKRMPMSKADLMYDNEQFEADTNVVSIGFSVLKQVEKNMGTGDPYFCQKCKAILNNNSKLFKKDEYMQFLQEQSKPKQAQVQKQKIEQLPQIVEKMEEEEEKLDYSQPLQLIKQFSNSKQEMIQLDDIKAHEMVWICEFCGHHSKLSIENEEIPKKDDMVYILQSANQMQANPNQHNNNNDDTSIIFCVDNSGSMSATTEIEGKVKLKHTGISEEEYEMLKQFLEPGAEHQQDVYAKKRNCTFVSSKQCVLAAFESQMLDLKKTHPNRKVGLVVFDNDVTIIGDAISHPEVVAGDKLYKYEEIDKIAKDLSKQMMAHPIQQTAESIISKFGSMRENGKTALGPALLASIGLLAQAKPGSMVLMCTDGLANIGLGSLDDKQPQQPQQEFYQQLGQYAQERGIVISVITIKGEGCKMETLQQLAELTSGSVTRVNPAELAKDFANIISDEIVATNVQFEIRLHNGLKFRNEDPDCLRDNGSVCFKRIGNATVNTEITFEYEVKTDEELQKENIEFDKIKEVPFQAQITYTSLEGHKFVRVLTKVQKMTKNQQVAEQNAKVQLLHKRAMQQGGQLAQAGGFQQAQAYNKRWTNYLMENSGINSSVSNQNFNVQYEGEQKKFRKAVYNKQKKAAPQKKGFFSNLFGSSSSQAPQQQQPQSMPPQSMPQFGQPGSFKEDQKQNEAKDAGMAVEEDYYMNMEKNNSEHSGISDDEQEAIVYKAAAAKKK